MKTIKVRKVLKLLKKDGWEVVFGNKLVGNYYTW